jgi:two-component system response regulator DesR
VIRLLLADDQELIRTALVAFLTLQPDVEVVAAVGPATGVSPLTARDCDVLVAARGGTTVAEIAEKLFLSERTVRNYLSAAISKVGARNRVQAVRTADQRGWL